MSRAVILSALAFVVAAGGSYGGYRVLRTSPDAPAVGTVAVAAVIDGDTLELSTKEKVRLTDVNAPELGACYGKEARDALRHLVLGNEVVLEKDITGSDDFGRLVRYVKVVQPSSKEDNILVNVWLVGRGYAVYAESENSLHQKAMIAAQARARAAGAGLWGACSPEALRALGVNAVGTPALPSDPSCVIKGNVTDVTKKKVYLLPHCPNYKTTTLNPAIGEQYFCSEAEATRAGFVKSPTCGNKE
jgi:micrococcal nuclease